MIPGRPGRWSTSLLIAPDRCCWNRKSRPALSNANPSISIRCAISQRGWWRNLDAPRAARLSGQTPVHGMGRCQASSMTPVILSIRQPGQKAIPGRNGLNGGAGGSDPTWATRDECSGQGEMGYGLLIDQGQNWQRLNNDLYLTDNHPWENVTDFVADWDAAGQVEFVGDNVFSSNGNRPAFGMGKSGRK